MKENLDKIAGLSVRPTQAKPKMDVGRYLQSAMTFQMMDRVDMTNLEAVEERCTMYLGNCVSKKIKPSVAGLALALGHDRRNIVSIVCGDGHFKSYSLEVSDYLKSIYMVLETMWESYMLNSDIQPVSGIFLGKNLFGYKDSIDYTVTNQSPADTVSADDIRKKYGVTANGADVIDSDYTDIPVSEALKQPSKDDEGSGV